MEPYVANIGVQYMEVEVLLLRDGGLLGGGSFRTRTGDGREVRRLARELLCMYGSCSSAEDFIAQLFSIPITSSSSSSSSYYSKGAVLQEFSKHVALVRTGSIVKCPYRLYIDIVMYVCVLVQTVHIHTYIHTYIHVYESNGSK